MYCIIQWRQLTICFIILIEGAIGRELEYDWVDGGACADLKRGGLDPHPRQTPANYPSDPLPLKKNLYTRKGGGGGSNQYLAAKLSNSFGLTFHSFSELSDIFYFSRGYIYKIDAIDTGT